MIGAIVKNNLVQRLIAIEEKNISEMQAALGCEIVDAAPYGLMVGDLRTERGWTRNAGGQQLVLALLDAKQYDGYMLAMEKLTAVLEQLEIALAKLDSVAKRLKAAGEDAIAEALAILTPGRQD